MKYIKLILTIIILVFSSLVNGQIMQPVKWEFSKKNLSKNIYELIFKAKIDHPFHLYSQDISVQPPATLFVFEKNDSVELIGNTIEMSRAIEQLDKNLGINVKYFEQEAIFVQKAIIKSTNKVIFKGSINYMPCDTLRCMPPTLKKFEFVFNEKQ